MPITQRDPQTGRIVASEISSAEAGDLAAKRWEKDDDDEPAAEVQASEAEAAPAADSLAIEPTLSRLPQRLEATKVRTPQQGRDLVARRWAKYGNSARKAAAKAAGVSTSVMAWGEMVQKQTELALTGERGSTPAFVAVGRAIGALSDARLAHQVSGDAPGMTMSEPVAMHIADLLAARVAAKPSDPSE